MTNVLKTKEEVEGACALLSAELAVALDLEGANLGKSGAISLIQVATKDNQCFIFDVLESECDVFQCGLKALLTREDVKKLMFDCRKDAEALKFIHNIDLKGVVDLQLMEIMARTEAAGSQEARERLHGFLHRGNVEGCPHLYQRVLRLSSLDHCMDRFKIGDIAMKKYIQDCFRDDASFWMKRPLPPVALQYAAQDVRLLFQLEKLIAATVGSRALDNRLLEESSSRYAKSILVSPRESCYSSHPLLPWGILDYLPSQSGGVNLPCVCCNVLFPAQLFPKCSKRTPEKRRCDICRAIDIKLATELNWSKNDNGDDDERYDDGYYSDGYHGDDGDEYNSW